MFMRFVCVCIAYSHVCMFMCVLTCYYTHEYHVYTLTWPHSHTPHPTPAPINESPMHSHQPRGSALLTSLPRGLRHEHITLSCFSSCDVMRWLCNVAHAAELLCGCWLLVGIRRGRVRVCVRVWIYTAVCVCIYVYIYLYMDVYIHMSKSRMHTAMHVYEDYMDPCIQPDTYAHAQTHKHACTCGLAYR